MSGNLKTNSITLYLKKDESDDIVVESALKQHHIEGIRFLYKEYEKKSPGVILNNPAIYENSLQVALFLGAIRNTKALLEKPVLIVCEENKEYDWLDHFQKQTQCYNVVVAATNPFVAKSIFINTMEGITAFTRRDWSVMVVDNDVFLKEKNLLAKFKADYKIWITQIDMKKNLQTFSIIYKWIFPKEKFNIDDFQPTARNHKDIISKAILLEAFFEDIVFKTHVAPLENKISIKNKDASGTKVKRSKRPVEEVMPKNIETNNGTSSAVKNPKHKKIDTLTDRNSSFSMCNNGKLSSGKVGSNTSLTTTKNTDEDIESFIRNKEPIKYDPFNEHTVDDDIADYKQEHEREFSNDTSHLGDKQSDYNFGSDTNSDSEIYKPKSNKALFSIISDSDDDSAYDLETQQLLEENIENEKLRNSNLHHDNNVPSNLLVDIKEPTDNEILNTNSEQKINEIHSQVNDEINKDEIEISNQTNDNLNPKHVVSKDPEDNDEMNELKKVNGDNKLNKDLNEDNKIDQNIKNGETQTSENESKRLNIDSKVTEHEDRIFKKFKGTLLDTIF